MDLRVPIPLTDDEKAFFDDLRAAAQRDPGTRGSLILSRMYTDDQAVAVILVPRYDVAGKRVGDQPLAMLLSHEAAGRLRGAWGEGPKEVPPEEVAE